jgi:hypothetical protein
MKRLRYIIIAVLSGMVFSIQQGLCQSPDKIFLTTDREVYFGGDNVWYKLSCFRTGSSNPSQLSKVAYMEVLTLQNYPVVQYKLLLTSGLSVSKFRIPDTLSTGEYLIRAYTGWMKNFEYQGFANKVITVINPFQKVKLINLCENYSFSAEPDETGPTAEIKVDSLHDEYGTRSLVDINILNAGRLKGLSVSVAKQVLTENNIKSHPEINDPSFPDQTPGKGQSKSSQYFLPEPEGMIVSGRIKNKRDNSPLINRIMTLSLVGKTSFLYLSKTDSTGTFRFVINQFGEKDMVIQPLSRDTTNLDFVVDLNPCFVSGGKDITVQKSQADDKFIEEINKCIVNMQVDALYKSYANKKDMPLPPVGSYNFYGDPEIKVNITRYVELPTMNEVFKEIVPSVAIRDKRKGNSFKVGQTVGGSVKNSFTLVDGIFIKDANKIMRMNPEDIKQIDVINLTYFLQDQELGAIISIQTHRGDLSALEFDNRIFRQAFSTYENTYSFTYPDYSVDSLRLSPMADFRNQLYWNPEVEFNEQGAGKIKFYTSDDTGKYMLRIEGFDTNGNKKRFLFTFSVRN